MAEAVSTLTSEMFSHMRKEEAVLFAFALLCEVKDHPAEGETPKIESLLKAGFLPEELDGNWKPYRAVGCSACNNGYKGRVGIYQVMPITDEMRRVIMRGGNALDISIQAQKEGISDLRRSGLRKVAAGVTSLEEIEGILNSPEKQKNYTKKELQSFKKQHDKIDRLLSGIKKMDRLPDMLFVIELERLPVTIRRRRISQVFQ